MTQKLILKNTLRVCALLVAGCASTFLIIREQKKANPPQPADTPAEVTGAETPTQSGVPAQTMMHSSKSLAIEMDDVSEFNEPAGTVFLSTSKSAAPTLVRPQPETFLPSSKFTPLNLINEEEPEPEPVYIMGSKSGYISPVDLEDLTPEKPKPKPKPTTDKPPTIDKKP
jgi:hypothetical protein